MKHFLIFVTVVFAGLFMALNIRHNQDPDRDLRPILRVYAPSSFIKQWGPGPWLKEKFESTCDCRVEYHDAADMVSLIQRVKSEPKNKSADLVLGFDQYDLEMAQSGLDWKPIKFDAEQFDPSVRPLLSRTSFTPYDWGILAFIGRHNSERKSPDQLDDLLAPEYASAISIQDPRTSTPGLEFLLWLIQVKGEEKAFEYLQRFNKQVKTWGANWSLTYGLFQKEQVSLTFSYVTSAIASLKDNPQSDIVALAFKEGHPVQYEFLGIPSTSQNSDLSQKFVDLILSHEGQKVIMERNFMFPVIQSVTKGTLFDSIHEFHTIDMTVIPNQPERERILKKWSVVRRAE